MSTTTRTARTTARLSAPIDLAEPAVVAPTLDDLMADDRLVVDVWDTWDGDDDRDGEAVVALMGDEAAMAVVGQDFTSTIDLLRARLHRGIGRQGDLPDGVIVTRYDGERPDVADAVVGVFVAAKRDTIARWRLLGDLVGEDA